MNSSNRHQITLLGKASIKKKNLFEKTQTGGGVNATKIDVFFWKGEKDANNVLKRKNMHFGRI